MVKSLNHSSYEKKFGDKLLLWNRQNGLCYFCRGEMLFCSWIDKPPQPPPDDYSTFDHLVDKTNSKTRVNKLNAIVLSCYHCNNSRAKLHWSHGKPNYRLREHNKRKKRERLQILKTK